RAEASQAYDEGSIPFARSTDFGACKARKDFAMKFKFGLAAAALLAAMAAGASAQAQAQAPAAAAPAAAAPAAPADPAVKADPVVARLNGLEIHASELNYLFQTLG